MLSVLYRFNLTKLVRSNSGCRSGICVRANCILFILRFFPCPCNTTGIFIILHAETWTWIQFGMVWAGYDSTNCENCFGLARCGKKYVCMTYEIVSRNVVYVNQPARVWVTECSHKILYAVWFRFNKPPFIILRTSKVHMEEKLN